MQRSPLLVTGLALGAVLAVLDLAGLAGLSADGAPSAAVVIAGAVLGLATLACVPAAWRGNRTAALATAVTRAVSALLAVPAFLTPDTPGWAKIVAAAAIATTAVAVALLWTASRPSAHTS